MTVAKVYLLTSYFRGEPKFSDFTLVEQKLPPVKDNEILVEAEYLSVDPYMRVYVNHMPLGSTMIGYQVGKIIESKHPKFPVGRRFVGHIGWRSHTVLNPEIIEVDFLPSYLSPDFGDLSSSLSLGVLGMPGNTAYFGFLEICEPKTGETVVISGAAGAVGSHVGQIAKNIGLTVIGIAGTDAKCKWLKDELGFDHAINYKTQNISAALKEAAPNGVDCYFDNVGGDISSKVLYQMNKFGRISVCGSISSYNADVEALPKCTIVQPAMNTKQLKMEGFVVPRWNHRWYEGIEKNLGWIREGKLKYPETVTEGFEHMFDAFVSMLRGENIGKAIVKVSTS